MPPTRKIRVQPSPPPSPPKRKLKKKRKGNWLWLWLLFIGISLLSAVLGGMLAVSLSTVPLQQVQLTPEERAVFEGNSISRSTFNLPELVRPVNILVLGAKVTDTDLGTPTKIGKAQELVNSFEGLTDTMLLLRFDPQAKRVVVLSIPRDTKTLVQGRGETKINEANDVGGAAGSAKATSNLLGGVPIDRYIRVNVQGIEKLLDALGGVTIYVPKDMRYQDDSQKLYIDLKQGKQHLDGKQALQFLRFRHDENGDIGRVQRQQMMMRALMEQTLNPVTLAKIPQIVSVIKDNIDTNLSVEEFVALGGFGVQVDRSKVEMLMVPGQFNGNGRSGISYWLPNQEQIKTIMAKHFNLGFSQGTTINPADINIAIQDSTKNPAAVKALVRKLSAIGYRVAVDDPWSEPLAKTRILAQGGYEESAQILQTNLGLGEVLVDSTGSFRYDVTIQLGKDWKAKPN